MGTLTAKGCAMNFVWSRMHITSADQRAFVSSRKKWLSLERGLQLSRNSEDLWGSAVLTKGYCPRAMYLTVNCRLIPVSAYSSNVGNVDASSGTFWSLSDGQAQDFYQLPSGLRLEVIVQLPETGSRLAKAPLVMIHGSYHAAWCWALFWMPFFAARGHECFALSLLGQGASDVPSEAVAGTIQSHAGDIAEFIKHRVTGRPIVIGHSFGGLIVQWYLSHMHPSDPSAVGEGHFADANYPRISAAILACSVPPSGNGPVVMRYIRRNPLTSIKITLSLAAKWFASSLAICRDTFFSPDLPDAQVKIYQELLNKSSHIPLFNLKKLNSTLPIPRPSVDLPPVLVLTAENDFIMDAEGGQETAAVYGTEPVVISGIGHDIMLDKAWEDAANTLYAWIEKYVT